MSLTAYQGNQPYIFISYAHKDSNTVLPILESLVEAGFRVWYDAGIMAGTEWPEYIATKLSESTCVIAFISKAALDSQNCRREINYAISEKKEMLTVYLEDVSLSPGMKMQLGTVQGIYYNRSSYDAFVQNLISAPVLLPCCGETVTTATFKKPASEGLTYRLNWIGESYTVTGIGTCQDPDIVIPSSYNGKRVTGIGVSAFEDCRSLESVIIPDSVTLIGTGAFEDCRKLASIVIPEGVTTICDDAFAGCNNLKSITIPNSVTSIGERAFVRCTSFTSITIPDRVTSVGDSAFWYCESLTDVTIGNAVTNIGKSAFQYCNHLTSVTLGNSITTIGETAFAGCNALEDIIIPDGVTSIGESAFGGCQFTSLTIPNSVTSIGKNAFFGCNNLMNIVIPESVTNIGDCVFALCSSDLTIYCEAESKPDGWNESWNLFGYPVVWGYKGE